MNVLELFSGIGGMHMALEESGVPGKVKAAIEINNVANSIYQHNFPETTLLNLNLDGVTAEQIRKFDVDTILMSPPCQPFTRNGLQNDVKDPRTLSFVNILNLLPDINIKRILIENVKGFESSEMREILIRTLSDNGFVYQEFLLSPSDIGVPNSRLRYYCLAKKLPETFSFKPGKLMEQLPSKPDKDCFCISNILDENVNSSYFLSETILKKRINILDICSKESKRSCCFTKAYGRYLEGTGSVFSDKTNSEVKECLEKLGQLNTECDEYLNLAKSLNLRFFTPTEICRIMCFPKSFSFPNNITNRQKYMVLGNSINVRVVSELIKLLI